MIHSITIALITGIFHQKETSQQPILLAYSVCKNANGKELLRLLNAKPQLL